MTKTQRGRSHLSPALRREASHVAETATRALLYEVSVSPKPGLVDRFDSGAHSDMDFFTFLDSTCALSEYFRSAFLLGCLERDTGPEELFSRLRPLGVKAEGQMYRATGGVNAHKGIIFTFGLFCGGMGQLFPRGVPFGLEELLALCGEMARPSVRDLAQLEHRCAETGGERYYAATGRAGVRGEAAAGYPSIRDVGLPTLRRALEQGYSYNDAGVCVLLELLCCVQDSNIFARCGGEKQTELTGYAQEILAERPLNMVRVKELNDLCIQDHVSPGGCADLLAATFFLHFIFD